MARTWAALMGGVAAIGLVSATVVLAAPAWDPPGLLREVAHKHVHLNGHSLLGTGLKHDGKHALGKLSGRDVTADVKGGKVTAMSAGDLPVKHFKSNRKMANVERGLQQVSLAFTPAQYVDVYYSYCFDDGYTLTCYWYPASEVDPSPYDWLPYDPTY